jgi:hypothetical protein
MLAHTRTRNKGKLGCRLYKAVSHMIEIKEEVFDAREWSKKWPF